MIFTYKINTNSICFQLQPIISFTLHFKFHTANLKIQSTTFAIKHIVTINFLKILPECQKGSISSQIDRNNLGNILVT